MATGDAPAEVATELPEVVKTIQDAVCLILFPPLFMSRTILNVLAVTGS